MEYPSILDKLFINIAVLRRAIPLTQKALAERLGVKNTTVSNWEKRVSCPQVVELIGLSKVFGISIDSLVFVDHSEAGAKASPSSEVHSAQITREEFNALMERTAAIEAAQKGERAKGKKAG